jgi:hypothetical protein
MPTSFHSREQRDGKIRADRLAAVIERIAAGADPWTQFQPMQLRLPTIRVDTECDYKPALPELSAFCRDANVKPEPSAP